MPQILAADPLVKPSPASLLSIPGVMRASAMPVPSALEDDEEDDSPSCIHCDTRMIGKLIKGRGMFYACPDAACPMYGIERS
jgi:hypothetical protein